jgi:GT2 family glycosyltransferase
MSFAADSSAARFQVTAVVVSHDGARWLPQLLSSLADSTRSPDVVIAVDTGSVDESPDLLRGALGPEQVVAVDRATGFGAAVRAGLDAVASAAAPVGRHAAITAAGEEWIWLLHDDCAPAPDALERLLETVGSDPQIAAVGCRLRAWPRARRLLEVGVTITGTAHRDTGLEPGEYDQGQYDEVRDVLAVSSAGMLVRRTAWESLGGFDPRLPLFRDDIDFGWRAAAAGHRVVVSPKAVVFHAEAASRGVREISSTARRPHLAARRAGVFTVLANCRAVALPFLYLRLLVGSLLRAAGYLIGKLPGAAWEELAGAASVLGRPWQIASARRWRRRCRTGPPVGVRRLLPPWWAPYAHGLDSVLTRGAAGLRQATTTLTSARRLRSGRGDATGLETGPVPEEAVNLPAGEGPLAMLARHPLLALTGGLTLAGLIASRGLWGSGFLQGGALLPAPAGGGDWWALFTESRHQVGLGSSLETAPYVALLALPAAVLLGKAWLVVDLLMMFAPVLAGAGAWAASSRLVRGVGTRLWMALAYGLVPVVTGAVGSGHLGTVVVCVVLPWIVRSGVRILDAGAPGRWGSAWATGLLLSVSAAFAPICWPIAVGVGAVAAGWLVTGRHWVRAAQWIVVLGLPLVLLMPWSWRVLTHPALVLTEAGGVVVPGDPGSGSIGGLAFLRIGAPGQAPWWVTGGLSVVAVIALLRADTRLRVGSAWLVAAMALAVAAVMAHQPVTAPFGTGQAFPWLGVPLVVAAGAFVAAAGIASDGLRSFVGSGAFGWRQPAAVGAVVLALSAPLLALGWWVGTAPHGVLHRAGALPVPAYMADAMAGDGVRVLVLRTGSATVRYRVLAGDGERLGDDSVLPSGGGPRLVTVVGDLLSQSRPDDVATLARLGIRYVVLPSPQDPSAVVALDGRAGLSRTSTARSVLSGWQVEPAGVAPAGARSDAGARDGLALGLALGWGLVVVLAAPAVRRRPLEALDVAR